AGGGYTGGWLSAWLFHAGAAGQPAEHVFNTLAGRGAETLQPEAEPLRRIREYSNYLDPKLGFLSVDVWCLVSTVARNLLLNCLVLVPFLAAALLVPRLYFAVTMLGEQWWLPPEDLAWWSEWLVAVGGTLLAMAMVYIVLDLPSVGNRQRTQRSFVEYCFGPLVTATGAFTLYWAWSRTLDADPVTARGLA